MLRTHETRGDADNKRKCWFHIQSTSRSSLNRRLNEGIIFYTARHGITTFQPEPIANQPNTTIIIDCRGKEHLELPRLGKR